MKGTEIVHGVYTHCEFLCVYLSFRCTYYLCVRYITCKLCGLSVHAMGFFCVFGNTQNDLSHSMSCQKT